MPIELDPTATQPASAEVQLLAECYALLLADIRRNRAKRLAQSAPEPTTLEHAKETASAQAVAGKPLAPIAS